MIIGEKFSGVGGIGGSRSGIRWIGREDLGRGGGGFAKFSSARSISS